MAKLNDMEINYQHSIDFNFEDSEEGILVQNTICHAHTMDTEPNSTEITMYSVRSIWITSKMSLRSHRYREMQTCS